MPPRAVINSAGYKILTSVDQYLELVGNSLPGKGAPIPAEVPCTGPGIWPRERAALIPELQAPHLRKDQLGLELRAGAQHELSPKRGGPRPRSESRLDLCPPPTPLVLESPAS